MWPTTIKLPLITFLTATVRGFPTSHSQTKNFIHELDYPKQLILW